MLLNLHARRISRLKGRKTRRLFGRLISVGLLSLCKVETICQMEKARWNAATVFIGRESIKVMMVLMKKAFVAFIKPRFLQRRVHGRIAFVLSLSQTLSL